MVTWLFATLTLIELGLFIHYGVTGQVEKRQRSAHAFGILLGITVLLITVWVLFLNSVGF